MLNDVITTPEVIKLYRDNGIPCDQATVSCLARQGRFKGRKIAGAWVVHSDSVMDDIRQLKKWKATTFRKNNTREGDNANQQT